MEAARKADNFRDQELEVFQPSLPEPRILHSLMPVIYNEIIAFKRVAC